MLTVQRGLLLIEKWRFFIEDCDRCYAWDISEYNNEIRVRDELENFLRSQTFTQFEGRVEFLQELFLLDGRLQDLFLPNSVLRNRDTWWKQGVLARAGEPYRDYMFKVYGFNVQLCA